VAAGRKVFVATQLFMSMNDKHLPYLSEVIEFHRVAHAGIVGIQLSEEIAIGHHPLEVLELIATLTADLE
jgi:pyruvate kinase